MEWSSQKPHLSLMFRVCAVLSCVAHKVQCHARKLASPDNSWDKCWAEFLASNRTNTLSLTCVWTGLEEALIPNDWSKLCCSPSNWHLFVCTDYLRGRFPFLKFFSCGFSFWFDVTKTLCTQWSDGVIAPTTHTTLTTWLLCFKINVCKSNFRRCRRCSRCAQTSNQCVINHGQCTAHRPFQIVHHSDHDNARLSDGVIVVVDLYTLYCMIELH